MSDMLLILLPGTMYFWTLFVGQGPFQEMLQERESRVLPRILACPVTPAQYILAKMLRCFLLCLLATVFLIVSSALLFRIHWGNPLALAFSTLACAGSMTGLLGLIYAAARTREQATVLSPVLLMLLAMVGGSMFPYENMPGFLQMVGRFTPNRWAVLVLQGVARSQPPANLVAPMTALLALAMLGSLVAFLVFRRRLRTGAQ